jgi:uncharacterized membrane protein YfcA
MRVARLMDPMVIAFGLGVGMLIGLTGIGGGSFMTLLLVLFAAAVAMAPTVIIAVPLAVGAVAWLIQRARPRTPELEVAPA